MVHGVKPNRATCDRLLETIEKDTPLWQTHGKL